MTLQNYNVTGSWPLGNDSQWVMFRYHSQDNVALHIMYEDVNLLYTMSISDVVPDVDSLAYELDYWTKENEVTYFSLNEYLRTKICSRLLVESWVE